MKTPILLMLIASLIFAAVCLGWLASYLLTGGKKMVLLRLAGASSMLAGLFWIVRAITER
jgi:hypothetical protein